MRVFITGGTGYVGRAVTRAFAAAGHQVTGLVRSPARADLLRALGGAPVLGNLRDPATYAGLAAEHEVVVHLAAEPGPDRQRIERMALEHLVDGAKATGEPRMLIHTSTVFVLGDTGSAAATEDSPVQRGGYAGGRAEHETLVLASADARFVAAVIRPGMVYGGGDGGAVSELFRTAHERGAATYVGEGRNRWTLVHRDDVGRLYRRVAEARARGIFHAVEGGSWPVIDLARRASVAVGHPGTIRSLPLQEARAELGAFADALCLDQVVDAPRAHALGWRPKHPGFMAAAEDVYAEWRKAAPTPTLPPPTVR